MPAFARFCAALAFALCALSTADAAPFGATAVGQSNTFAPCTSSVTTASIPVTVDVPSRLLVTVSGSTVSADNTNIYAVSYTAHLFDASGTVEIGTGTSKSVVAGVYLIAMADSEVLFDPSLSQAATLDGGTYQLKLDVETSGSCSGAGVYLQSPTLTYVLLSSALDRVFANGFASLGATPAREPQPLAA